MPMQTETSEGCRWSDEEAMARLALEDDAQAFTFLVHRWRGAIERLCMRMLGDATGAQDAAQDVFLRLYIRRSDFDPERGRFSSFLWRMALNRCYDELRRRRANGEHEKRALELMQAVPGRDPTLKAVMCSEEGVLVRRALSGLPEHYRAVLVLRHYQGMKFREIAEILEVPEGTVCSRMAEGLHLLAVELSTLREHARDGEGGTDAGKRV